MNSKHIHKKIVICFLLGLSSFIIYNQTRYFQFVNFDDPLYVTNNRVIKKGLTPETVRWAFTESTFHSNYWAPLTWLSIIGDYEFSGAHPGGYHTTNLWLHVFNSILLFLVLGKVTRSLWPSAFIAAMFAVHPLHVESVAWVTERKDVLSAFFWILTMAAYFRYCERSSTANYLIVLFTFILGLMAKPILITLPFVLLLLDFWPLGRFKFSSSFIASVKSALPLVTEKIPLLVIVLAAGIGAYIAQKAGGAIEPLTSFPIGLRIQVVLNNYFDYIAKTLFPFNLAVIYPYPDSPPLWRTAAAFSLLALVSYISVKKRETAPWFIVGWLWYLGTLVPVIGIVVIGPHALADRYTYISQIGLTIMAAWEIPALLRNPVRNKTILPLFGTSLLLLFTVLSWNQTRYWENSITLFTRTLAVTSKNSLAHNNLGTALNEKGRTDEAIIQFEAALEIQYEDAVTHLNLADALVERNRLQEAADHCREALRIWPNRVEAYLVLGRILMRQNHYPDAVRLYNTALGYYPEDSNIHNNLGAALLRMNQVKSAAEHFQKAVALDPENRNARLNLESADKLCKTVEGTIRDLNTRIVENPGDHSLYFQLGKTHELFGEFPSATGAYRKALSLNPAFTPAMNRLAIILSQNDELDQAIALFKQITEILPQQKDAYYNIACLYARQGNEGEALGWLQAAVEKGYNNLEGIKKDKDLEYIRHTDEYARIIRTLE